MTNETRKIVGVIITNKQRDLFYFQQKDETYHLERWRLAYSLFGGTVNVSEDDDNAMMRELIEELEDTAANLVIKNLKKVFVDCFVSSQEKNKKELVLFEALLTNKELNEISLLPIKEGKKGVLLTRDMIIESNQQFIADDAIKKYIKLSLRINT